MPKDKGRSNIARFGVDLIILSLFPPKLWSWKSHQGYGRKSFNPLYKEREYLQYEIKKQFTSDLISCPVRIEYDFFFEVPASTSQKKKLKMIEGEIPHTKKVDVTNLVKFTEDCLKGVVIIDDCQVIEFSARKKYGKKCSIIIKIFPVENEN
jgi:Holliday junction resolvase RusA-like endonuclease